MSETQNKKTNTSGEQQKDFVFPERKTASDAEYANKILLEAFPSIFKKKENS